MPRAFHRSGPLEEVPSVNGGTPSEGAARIGPSEATFIGQSAAATRVSGRQRDFGTDDTELVPFGVGHDHP
jgi:hypothetical protein